MIPPSTSRVPPISSSLPPAPPTIPRASSSAPTSPPSPTPTRRPNEPLLTQHEWFPPRSEPCRGDDLPGHYLNAANGHCGGVPVLVAGDREQRPILPRHPIGPRRDQSDHHPGPPFRRDRRLEDLDEPATVPTPGRESP